MRNRVKLIVAVMSVCLLWSLTAEGITLQNGGFRIVTSKTEDAPVMMAVNSLVRDFQKVAKAGNAHPRQEPNQGRVLLNGIFQKVKGAVPIIKGAVKVVNQCYGRYVAHSFNVFSLKDSEKYDMLAIFC